MSLLLEQAYPIIALLLLEVFLPKYLSVHIRAWGREPESAPLY